MAEVIEKSLKDLKAELVALGMPAEDTEVYQSKAQIMAILNVMKTKEVVKRVETLEDKETAVEKKNSEKQYISKARTMRSLLLSQPTVRTILPLSGTEKPGRVEWRTGKDGEKYQFHAGGTIETVQLNGFKWLIPKGVPTDVPQQISETLDNSYLQTMSAGADISLDRIDPQTGRPMSDVLSAE